MAEESRTPVDVVISAQRLKEEFESGASLVVLEVGRSPADGNWAATGHLPGAHYVSLETQLAGERYLGSGSHPLPTEAIIQAEVTRWGITHESLVVVYTRDNPAVAARAWWTLACPERAPPRRRAERVGRRQRTAIHCPALRGRRNVQRQDRFPTSAGHRRCW